MSLFRNITRSTNLLVLINKTNLILYEMQSYTLTAKLTVPLSSDYSPLQKFLEEFTNPVVEVVIDQTGDIDNTISIPDIGSVKIDQKIKFFTSKGSPDIAMSLITKKPKNIDEDWKFIVTKNNLDQETKNALSTILESDAEVQGIYLSLSSNITLCQNLSKILKKELSISQDHPLFIYLQDSNGYVYEFEILNHKVVSIKSRNLKKEKIEKYINEQLKKHNSSNDSNKNSILVLLPEPLRTKIHTYENQSFMSPAEICKKHQKTAISTQATYTALLFHITYTRFRPEPLPIRQVKKYKTVFLLNKTLDWVFAGTACALIYLTASMFISYNGYQKDIIVQQKAMRLLEKDYEHSFRENLEKENLIQDNPDAKALYKIINNNQFATKTLDSISKSNTHNIPITKFLYLASPNSSSGNKIELLASQKSTSEVKEFVENLKKNLPQQDVLSFVNQSEYHNIMIRILYAR